MDSDDSDLSKFAIDDLITALELADEAGLPDDHPSRLEIEAELALRDAALLTRH
jgi:hypothetical protein